MAQKQTGKKSNSEKNTSKGKNSKYPNDTYVENSFFLSNTFIGIVFAFLGFFVFAGYFSDDGKFILFITDFLKGLVGYGFIFCAPALFSCAIIYLLNRKKKVGGRIACTLFLPIILSSIISLISKAPERNGMEPLEFCKDLYSKGMNNKSGGVFGGLISTGLENAFGLYGAMAVLIVLLVFSFFFAYKISIKSLFMSEPDDDTDVSDYPSKPARKAAKVDTKAPVRADNKKKVSQSYDLPLSAFDDDEPIEPATGKAVIPPVKNDVKKRRTAVLVDFDDSEDDVALAPVNQTMQTQDTVAAVPQKKRKPVKAAVSIKMPEKQVQTDPAVSDDSYDGEYSFPPVDLLNQSPTVRTDSSDEIEANKERLQNALHSFGINAEVADIIHGPTVTRYDIELEQGVKLSRVTNLSGDIALSLGVINVRIAPIPDKISTVGIEVPNRIISTVYLRDIISSQEFIGAKSKLSFAIGKDIGGNSIVGNISKLPHLLIAGTTGSGKSVCMNSLILSLLYKASPDEVRLIMIDPKMVELGVYNGIPHLYVPVVTDPKKASGALQWSVVEMLKRYQMFSEAKVRDIQSYNKICASKGEKQMPNIVVVIDELADLMMIASKEVEESICRVAQMGRAAGMHLIIATQRPSADIITGLMKANIPSRIAFAVSSAMESRIILDQGGAEKLVGMGDMLFSPVGCGKPTRIQGAYVSDEEREEVINFIKEHSECTSSFNSEIDEYMNKAMQDKKGDGGKDSDSASSGDSDYDEMLEKAVETIIDNPEAGCSVSMLQRRVKLGYARAARIVDQMEELGIVGPYEGAKPRKVVADRSRWEEIKSSIGLGSGDDTF